MCKNRLKMNQFCYLVFLTLMAFGESTFASENNAQRTPATISDLETIKDQSGQLIHGPIGDVQKQMVDELIGDESTQIPGPRFPRVSLNRSRSEIINSNINLGGRIPFTKMGAEVSIDFKYSLKTTFFMIASKHSFDGHPAADIRSQMIVYDKRTHMSYPNVALGSPMVGMCTYEASLIVERTKSGSMGGFGFSKTLGEGTHEDITRSTFSNFFQLKGDESIPHYLYNVCGQIFLKTVRDSVVNDFSNLVLERLLSDNPDAACKPPLEDAESASLGQTKYPNGDPTCLNWHKETFHETVQKITVPRCELQKEGYFKCVAKGRSNTSCPVFINRKTGGYGSNFDRSGTSLRVTHGHYEFDCDGNQGLSCKMSDMPLLFFNTPIVSGSAQCR